MTHTATTFHRNMISATVVRPGHTRRNADYLIHEQETFHRRRPHRHPDDRQCEHINEEIIYFRRKNVHVIRHLRLIERKYLRRTIAMNDRPELKDAYVINDIFLTIV